MAIVPQTLLPPGGEHAVLKQRLPLMNGSNKKLEMLMSVGSTFLNRNKLSIGKANIFHLWEPLAAIQQRRCFAVWLKLILKCYDAARHIYIFFRCITTKCIIVLFLLLSLAMLHSSHDAVQHGYKSLPKSAVPILYSMNKGQCYSQ